MEKFISFNENRLLIKMVQFRLSPLTSNTNTVESIWKINDVILCVVTYTVHSDLRIRMIEKCRVLGYYDSGYYVEIIEVLYIDKDAKPTYKRHKSSFHYNWSHSTVLEWKKKIREILSQKENSKENLAIFNKQLRALTREVLINFT